jgi:hypothetical protein
MNHTHNRHCLIMDTFVELQDLPPKKWRETLREMIRNCCVTISEAILDNQTKWYQIQEAAHCWNGGGWHQPEAVGTHSLAPKSTQHTHAHMHRKIKHFSPPTLLTYGNLCQDETHSRSLCKYEICREKSSRQQRHTLKLSLMNVALLVVA